MIHLPEINRVAKENSNEADDKLLHYCMEGIRLNGTFGLYRESVANIIIDDDGRQVSIKPGDKVFVSFVCYLYPPLFSFAKREAKKSSRKFYLQSSEHTTTVLLTVPPG
jgi:hypothetical protein